MCNFGSFFEDVGSFFSGLTDTKWGSGQPGDQQYDPGYGTPAQNPDPQPLAGTPGAFNPGDPTNTPGQAFLNPAFSPVGSGTVGSGGGELNPVTAGGGVSSTAPPTSTSSIDTSGASLPDLAAGSPSIPAYGGGGYADQGGNTAGYPTFQATPSVDQGGGALPSSAPDLSGGAQSSLSDLAAGSSGIPSYGGGDYADLGAQPSPFAPPPTQDQASSSPLLAPPPAPVQAAPPVSFGGVQSFGGDQPANGQSSLGSASISDLAASGSSAPLTGFASGGGAGFQTSFEPGGGISIPNDFPDPTSVASTASSGGTPSDSSTVFDPFNTRDPNKDQDRVSPGAAFGVPTAPTGNDQSPVNSQPTAGTPPASIQSSYTPSNVGGTPSITSLAAAATPSADSLDPNAAYGTNPQTREGARNVSAYGETGAGDTQGAPEAFPGADSLAKTAATGGSGGGTKEPPSALDQLASSLGRNALPAAIAGIGGLYSIIQGNKNANTPNVQGMKSEIPQIQSLIDTVNQMAAQLSAQAQPLRDQGQGIINSATGLQDQGKAIINSGQPLRDQGGNIINSAQPISAESQRLMSFVSTGTLPPEYMTQVQEGTKAAKAAAISNAAARGQNVSPGPNGDYSGNSTLQQQLQSIDRQATILSSTLAQQLYDAGVKGIAAANSTISAGTGVINAGNQTTQTGTGVIGAANQTIGAGTGVIQAGNSTQQNATALTTAGLNGIQLQQNVYKQLIDLDTARAARVGAAIQNFAGALGGGTSGAPGTTTTTVRTT